MSERKNLNKKEEQLESFVRDTYNQEMISNEGKKIVDDENSLTAGERGPTLIEDFLAREKLAHFDRERIPERVVHARGYGAHGEFELYQSMSDVTMADFLQDPAKKTPLFVRFSQVVGSKGCNETVRDVRGFSIKFYTNDGNFDIVGINMPVFFIQDAIKFPDLIHSVKPEPDNEYPQGQTAHDTFWDFMGSNPETTHMAMWIMSDRAIPKNYRTMEGFGVHTYRFVNKDGVARFIKFHVKPVLGVHPLIWDEAQKLGEDADFHRRDLWTNIKMGNHPEYELAVQIIEEDQEFMFDFDILDPTKLWPEEEVPLQKIGKITLNRTVDNAFSETEQSAFHPGNIVRGVDYSNDPLLQGRLFSYTDTQQARLGPNYQQLPINKPIVPVYNNQRDGASRYVIDRGKVSYHKNLLAGNTPSEVPVDKGGFVTYPSSVEGLKKRKTAPSFKDHYSQARLFWNSMTPVEREHIIGAYSFELGRCLHVAVRQQMVDRLARVSRELAEPVAKNVGVTVPNVEESTVTKSSPAISLMNTTFVANTLKVAIFLAEGFPGSKVDVLLKQWKESGMHPVIVSNKLGEVNGSDGYSYKVDQSFLTGSPLSYEGAYLVGGTGADDYFHYQARTFIMHMYNHFKPIGAIKESSHLLKEMGIEEMPGVIIDSEPQFGQIFIDAMAKQRFWERPSYLYHV
ncbi:catalase [Sedimentibacter hydroxybenzoicus DSM 7310]|uniref:Catalase n=1 Tax=Sedimentibacter hydroxybenzoicus DSM 7310 TaxID=1123245 RepID=A0A974BHY9_SEDHY|nr:catalase [Sedimentibacter hydroxybenzoicus]NYB73452.1 catalase [Sedimentibacter hydroxybenzoicus DSM 7310]